MKKKELDNFIENGSRAIHFNKMTTDKDYLEGVFKYFGIGDVNVQAIDLKNKINKWPRAVDRLPKDIHEIIWQKCEWFIKKYNL